MEKKFVVNCRAVILHEGKLLVVKHPHDTSFVALPGGHLEWGEDIKECLCREIIEELGVRPKIGRLLYINNYLDADIKQEVQFFFEITNSNEYKDIERNVRTHAHEIAEILWINPTDDILILPKKLGEDFRAGKILSNEIRYIKN